MNFTNSILLELKETNITKIIKAIKYIEKCGIVYKIIEDIPPAIKHINVRSNNYLISEKGIGNKSLKVLDLLSKGKSYNQIAKEVDISVDGVRYHIKKVFKALGVNNGRDALRIYINEMKQVS